MTGASPGAHVILGANFIGTPWLLGGYSGSEKFAYTVLSNSNIDTLKSAWILTAPTGRIKLPDTILKDVGLDFPNNYVKVGTVKTGYRSETQELWKVKNQG